MTATGAPDSSQEPTRPRLLVLELWGLGDLALATQFLRAACSQFEVHLAAKPFAVELQPVLWPGVTVHVCQAPWTAFRGKYRLWAWPWGELRRLVTAWRRLGFAAGVSARQDPRDHVLLRIAGARQRVGIPRWGSQVFLGEPLHNIARLTHRVDCWRAVASVLGLELAAVGRLPQPRRAARRLVIHTGAARAVRVWPLDRFARLAAHCQRQGWLVSVAGDPGQEEAWRRQGAGELEVPATVSSLVHLLEGAAAFLGNDSGPGHVAAALGIPTFTIFGPQLPQLFLPVHPDRGWVEGRPCTYKPCWDNCRFPEPFCLMGVPAEEVIAAADEFLRKLGEPPDRGAVH